MLSKILLPYSFQWIGRALFVLSSVLAFMTIRFEFEWLEIANIRRTGIFSNSDENFTNEVAVILLFISLFFIAFSKEKKEDEYIQKIRLDSILFATYGYFILNIIGTMLLQGFDFSFILLSMYSSPLLFVALFRWVMFSQRQSLDLVL